MCFNPMLHNPQRYAMIDSCCRMSDGAAEKTPESEVATSPPKIETSSADVRSRSREQPDDGALDDSAAHLGGPLQAIEAPRVEINVGESRSVALPAAAAMNVPFKIPVRGRLEASGRETASPLRPSLIRQGSSASSSEDLIGALHSPAPPSSRQSTKSPLPAPPTHLKVNPTKIIITYSSEGDPHMNYHYLFFGGLRAACCLAIALDILPLLLTVKPEFCRQSGLDFLMLSACQHSFCTVAVGGAS